MIIFGLYYSVRTQFIDRKLINTGTQHLKFEVVFRINVRLSFWVP